MFCNFAYPDFGVRKAFLYVCQAKKESLRHCKYRCSRKDFWLL